MSTLEAANTPLPGDAPGPSHTPDTVAPSPQPRYNTSSPVDQPPQAVRRGMFSTLSSAVKPEPANPVLFAAAQPLPDDPPFSEHSPDQGGGSGGTAGGSGGSGGYQEEEAGAWRAGPVPYNGSLFLTFRATLPSLCGIR